MKRIRRGVMKVGGWFARHRWPEVSGTIKVAGLLAPVEVIRDRWGVPHIYAQSAHDLVFAQGYVHAQDRLWEMEMTRRLTKGTISEVMGKAGLAADRWYVSQGVRGLEKQNWQELDDEGRTLLQDYAAGINTYIDTHRSRLPLEFTILRINPASWTPLDSLALGNVL